MNDFATLSTREKEMHALHRHEKLPTTTQRTIAQAINGDALRKKTTAPHQSPKSRACSDSFSIVARNVLENLLVVRIHRFGLHPITV